LRKAIRSKKIPDNDEIRDFVIKEYMATRYRLSPRDVETMTQKEIDAFLIIGDEKNKIEDEKSKVREHKATVEKLRRTKI